MTKVKIDYSYTKDRQTKEHTFIIDRDFDIIDLYDKISEVENIDWLIPARERGGERNEMSDVALAAITEAGVTDIKWKQEIIEC